MRKGLAKVEKLQCKAKSRSSLYTERCGSTAVVDSLFCASCKRRRQNRSLKKAVGINACQGIGHLPMAYRYLASTALREKLNQIAGQESPLEQLGLFEELKWMRAISQQALSVYDMANHAEGSENITLDAKLKAGELAKKALEDIARMAEKAAKIEGMAADKLSIAQLGVVIDQIVQLAADVFGVDEETLERVKIFASLVDKRVKIPTFETKGTALTPDQDVTEMGNTVPLCIETTAAGTETNGNGHHLNGNGHDESL